MSSPTQAQIRTPPWIYNPWLDLMVGCGAWSAPLLLFWYLSDTDALAWSATFYGLAIFFNYPHYMATLYRAYHTSEDFQKYRIFTVHITALIVLTLVVSHFWYRALPWLFTVYLTWSPWHYSGQNYGLFMMFARRAGAKPSDNVRQAMYSAFLLSYLILFLSFHTGHSRDPLFISLGIPEKMSMPIVIALGVGFFVSSLYGLLGLLRQAGWRPLLPSLTLFSTQFLWFLLPTVLTLSQGLRLTQSRYSTGVLAIMHSAQYLWITSYYARQEASSEKRNGWRPLAYFGVLIAGGIALFVPGPWLASKVFHYDLTASFLIFSALVNIHHFILDGAIWKLRDGRIAALLLNSRESLAKAKAQAGGSLSAAMRWLMGSSSAARILRVSAAVALLTWGIYDQAHYYLALHQDNLLDLERAASMASFDSSVQTQLGRIQFADGKVSEAVLSWQKALSVNPAASAPRDALLRYLTSQKRFQEAYDLSSQSLDYASRDSNLLVNHGILALQLGHPEEAVANWTKAVTLDPQHLLARLYLASELDRTQKCDLAIPHYRSFLQQVAQIETGNRPPAQDVVAVALRSAQCQESTNRLRDAIQSYALARKIASQAGLFRLESIASANEARLYASQKKMADALPLYQRTIELDRSANDLPSEAADWFSYGLFLKDAGFPLHLAYACFVQSESLFQTLQDDPKRTSAQTLREEMGIRLGAQARELRRNPQAALEQALHLKGQN